MDALNLIALEKLAERELSAMTWGYYYGGADDEVTLRRNRCGDHDGAEHPEHDPIGAVGGGMLGRAMRTDSMSGLDGAL